MPEGDTIHSLVRLMRPDLEGHVVRELVVRRHGRLRRLEGETVTRIEARGKNLLVHVGRVAVLVVHLGMDGTWHRYAPGERWRRPHATAHVVLATAADVFVCFDPSEAEVVRTSHLAVHPRLSRLGPDLLAAEVDFALVLLRARRSDPGTRIRDLVLDQRVAAGIGNVFKCETLFLERLDPDRDLGALSDERLLALYRVARRLMQDNVGRLPRVTRPTGDPRRDDQRSWVYGRHDRPCHRCGTLVRCDGEGGDDRLTWWCPGCQIEP